MQCPKCEYTASPGESEVEGKCPSCGVYYHKVARTVDTEVSPVVDRNTSRKKWFLVFLVVAVIVAAAGYFGVKEYSHWQLVKNVDVVIRQANGQVAELVDEKAKRTNAEFLRAYQIRIDTLDSLVARALAINDASSPGVSSATADYVRASRGFLKTVKANVDARIDLSVKTSTFSSLKGYESDELVSQFIGLTDIQVNALLEKSINEASKEDVLTTSLDKLRQATIYEGLAKKRRQYLNARDDMESSRKASEDSLREISKAGAEVKQSGGRIELLLGEDLPVQGWKVSS